MSFARPFVFTTACLLTTGLVSTATFPATAQSEESEALDAAQQRIAELEAQVEQLQAEIESLRTQLSETGGVEMNIGGDASDSAMNNPMSDEPALRNVNDVFRLMPRDLLPRRGAEWSDTDRRAAQAWLRENIVGRRLETRFELQDVESSRDPFADPQLGGESESPWLVNFYAQSQSFSYGGNQITPVLRLDAIHVDDAYLQRARRLREGQILPLSGMISGAEFGDLSDDELELTLEVSDVSINSPLLNVPEDRPMRPMTPRPESGDDMGM